MLPRLLVNNVCRIVTYCSSSKVSPEWSCILSSNQARSILQTIFITGTSKHTSASLSEKHDPDLNQAKTKLILQMNFRSGKDAVPFYKLPIKTLIHVFKVTKVDEAKGYCKNRLYYISEKLQECTVFLTMFTYTVSASDNRKYEIEIRKYIGMWQGSNHDLPDRRFLMVDHPPSVVSEHLAQRIFVYSLSFHWLQQSLELLLEMGVSGDRILRDLWVLKYHHDTIKQRLQRVKHMGVDNLYPWMIRCSEDILNRSIEISKETKTILGECKSTQTYLADRLHTTPEAVQDMCMKVPALKTIRVTKVKQFLDFLINEGFQVEDIASKLRVITASKKTVQQRLDKLRKLGITNINLNVLCRSKKDFKKYCQTVETFKENIDGR